ncbi:hypothetical protein BOH73_07365 [Pseudomonas versuta]|uniref:Transposase n=1 Tax=Pseudomonas versuta TaxID=1788301 RepID=A0ABX3EBD5_9PSED|nr:hypothetical protein BOH73_07365 [Pseudomonas versuta]
MMKSRPEYHPQLKCRMDNRGFQTLRRLLSCRSSRSTGINTAALARINFKNKAIITYLRNYITLIFTRLRNLLWSLSVKSTFLRIRNVWQVSICFKHAIWFARFRSCTATVITSYFYHNSIRHDDALISMLESQERCRAYGMPNWAQWLQGYA